MSNRFLLAALTLAAFLPTLALAQAEPAQREGSWELSAGAGAMYLDGHLAGALAGRGFADSGSALKRLMPAAAVRLGYNFNNNIGFSIGTGGGLASGVKYLTPFAALTYTVNLNATTSPFLTAGTQFTRITGNGRVTHPTWGAHFGLGVRHMVSEYLALRLEGRMGVEHYEQTPGKKTAYNSIATLGFSYFTAGRRAPPAPMAAAPCPACGRARVDTVRIYTPAPPPPHKCEHGVAPAGAKVDQFGCLVLRDTLLLEAVHFEFDKSEITPTAVPILDRVAESMIVHPELYFEIAGHTDSVGTFAYNFLLSARRAAAVKAYLVSRGVPPGRMTAVGYGEGFPIAPNATVEGRALNRRGLEIRVLRPY
ncbi:MAG TPA: OmpA family protein [Gemmatimonadales bacterium]|jgi:outer membrane protein OmpA-like peptidoglycan-associated protein|nr:OmpA family protein [Gemmatimonadales bacterium]